ncbi:helix-turn-helix domain-containing protein [Longitalea arenae]|uniref:helix-turn-helix domain-containing protein n=1 Tax=Longitalea arenae TaxID=2812558 RepID=UPI001967C40B|nr:AraC family transcriptional regulator [Longitalea arenae]
MVNYYKYLPVSEEDESWGLSVLNTGCTHIVAGSSYPYATHPAHHYFNWEKGRVLHEFQVIYITQGGGIFESKSSGPQTITAGSVILLFPEERHRYKPDERTGWDEYWVGCNGPIVENLLHKKFFTPHHPVIPVGYHESLVHLFQEIIHTTREEKAGYQPLIAGTVLHLLGNIYSLSQQEKFSGQDVEAIVDKARLLFRSNIDQNYSPVDVAHELQISYSRFRKIFKEYTGLAPGQFQIQLKIHKAKELLTTTTKSVKEIAFELNFESNFYFSKLFKEKTGVTPGEFRKGVN